MTESQQQLARTAVAPAVGGGRVLAAIGVSVLPGRVRFCVVTFGPHPVRSSSLRTTTRSLSWVSSQRAEAIDYDDHVSILGACRGLEACAACPNPNHSSAGLFPTPFPGQISPSPPVQYDSEDPLRFSTIIAGAHGLIAKLLHPMPIPLTISVWCLIGAGLAVQCLGLAVMRLQSTGRGVRLQAFGQLAFGLGLVFLVARRFLG